MLLVLSCVSVVSVIRQNAMLSLLMLVRFIVWESDE